MYSGFPASLTTVWRWPPDTFCGAEIIRQFKQVASDRAGAERRIFVANDVVRDVIHLMDSQIRKSETRVVLDLQPDIELDSYPGIFGQVLQNLVENAPVHAFEIDAPGVIRIVMRDAATTDALVLTVADNGKGIPEEQRERIWTRSSRPAAAKAEPDSACTSSSAWSPNSWAAASPKARPRRAQAAIRRTIPKQAPTATAAN
jgi:hypothetical protein